jgi:ubiquinone/menaquinone biosynthesis C-methylase UbiE
MRKPDYGIDAPIMQRNLAILGLACVAMLFLWRKVGVYTVWPGITFLLAAIWLRFGSRVVKLKLAERLVGAIPWSGDEQALDVGCGHGLMTVYAAKRLKTGTVTGVDVWRQFDQAHNRPEKVLDNAKIEGVGRLVKVQDGDARELPFPDESFDVVLSSWAIHNIAVGAGREKAIREMFRVLRPGGWLGVLDSEIANELEATVKKLGMAQIQRSGPSFCFISPSYQIVAQKAPAPAPVAVVA